MEVNPSSIGADDDPRLPQLMTVRTTALPESFFLTSSRQSEDSYCGNVVVGEPVWCGGWRLPYNAANLFGGGQGWFGFGGFEGCGTCAFARRGSVSVAPPSPHVHKMVIVGL